jgi:hypothetical protein
VSAKAADMTVICSGSKVRPARKGVIGSCSPAAPPGDLHSMEKGETMSDAEDPKHLGDRAENLSPNSNSL